MNLCVVVVVKLEVSLSGWDSQPVKRVGCVNVTLQQP